MALGLMSRYPNLAIERDKLLRDVQLDSYEIQDAVKSFEELVIEVEAKEHYSEHTRVVDYLKAKYQGFVGLPVPMFSEELLLDETTPEFKAVKKQIMVEMGKKVLREEDFVPFEIVADALLALKELKDD